MYEEKIGFIDSCPDSLIVLFGLFGKSGKQQHLIIKFTDNNKSGKLSAQQCSGEYIVRK